ncbi:MAG: hypothetical protein Q7S58_02885 [Candidatus Binatus sp.]|uniref:hypothetical protein n=1 Tax=Candidatus Binatus sp. TaxID=2811406 RepID=UPI002720DF18|nr:hypothetical protein [Candidatus Binatus sp.]MDO8431334.1 hypothetical protein [Candidatus Binatus sp.]
MPSRYLRDSILASRTLADLSDFAERLFFRLLVVADDFGRFNSDPSIVRSVCFPLLTDAIKCTRIEKALDELIRSGIARFYLADSKVIGELINFTKFQQPRAKKSKFPEPASGFVQTFANVREQLHANVSQKQHGRAATDRYRDRDRGSDLRSDPDPIGEQFEQFYSAYPRRQAKREAEVAWRKLNPGEQLREQILDDIRQRYAATEPKFIPLPATYLRGARWTDEIIRDQSRVESAVDMSKRLIIEAEERNNGNSSSSEIGRHSGRSLSLVETSRGNVAAIRRDS